MNSHSTNDEDQEYRDRAQQFLKNIDKIPVNKNRAGEIIAAALHGIEELKKIIKKTDNDYLNLAVLQNISIVTYGLQNDFETAAIESMRGIEILEKVNNQADEYLGILSRLQSNIGANFGFFQEKYEEAIIWTKRSIETLEKKDKPTDADYHDLTTTLLNLSRLYSIINAKDLAEETNLKIINVLDKIKNQTSEYFVLLSRHQHNHGNSFASRGKYEEAIIWFKKSIETQGNIDQPIDVDYHNLAISLLCLGHYYSETYDYKLAEETNLKTFNVLNKFINKMEMDISLYRRLYDNMKDLFPKNTDAYLLFQFAEQVFGSNHSPYGEFAKIHHQISRKINVNKDFSDCHYLLQFMLSIREIINSKHLPRNEFIIYLREANHFEKFEEQIMRLEPTLSDLVIGSPSLIVGLKTQIDQLKRELAETKAQCAQLQIQLAQVKEEKSEKSALVTLSLVGGRENGDVQVKEEEKKLTKSS
jgi:tetratricopeptide (TPR) repeat protein